MDFYLVDSQAALERWPEATLDEKVEVGLKLLAEEYRRPAAAQRAALAEGWIRAMAGLLYASNYPQGTAAGELQDKARSAMDAAAKCGCERYAGRRQYETIKTALLLGNALMSRRSGEYLDPARRDMIGRLAMRQKAGTVPLEQLEGLMEADKKGPVAAQEFLDALPPPEKPARCGWAAR